MAQPTNLPKQLQINPAGSMLGQGSGGNKTLRVTFGFAGADVLADTAQAYQLVAVPAGTIIESVRTRVITAFTATVTLTIGDSNAAAGYLASAKIAPQTADAVGIYQTSLQGTQDAYAAGRKYLTAGFILVTSAVATIAAGLLEVLVDYLDGPAGTS